MRVAVEVLSTASETPTWRSAGGAVPERVKKSFAATCSLRILQFSLNQIRLFGTIGADVRQSLELTGAWINEAREIPKSILDTLTGRVGRYPARSQGGATWSGVILDTNPPDSESWWYKYAEQETPDGWAFFNQPSGTDPRAENLANLPKNYYQRLLAGKDADWIKVFVHGEYGYVAEGKPVFPMFRDSVHVADHAVRAIPELSLLIGVDFGLTPAAVIGQKLADGRWIILGELTTEGTGVIRFAEQLSQFVAINYPDCRVEAGWGDPAGNVRSQNDERTAISLLQEHTGWRWRPAPVPSNDFTIRREVVVAALNRMVDGKPGLILSPSCTVLRKGFVSGYHYRRVSSPITGIRYHDKPAKNAFSHPHDALQYLLLGGGEHQVVMNRTKRRRRKPVMARDLDYDLFAY